jgi:subtilisin family serine protease
MLWLFTVGWPEWKSSSPRQTGLQSDPGTWVSRQAVKVSRAGGAAAVPASDQTSSEQFSEDAGMDAMIDAAGQGDTRSGHPAWPGAKVLAVSESPSPLNGLTTRRTILQSPDFPHPVHIEERLNTLDKPYRERVVSRIEAVADHLLVKLKPDTEPEFLAAIGRTFDWELRAHPTAPGLFYLQLPAVEPGAVSRACEILALYPDIIEFAEPDAIVRAAAAIPDDPSFEAGQWSLNNTGQDRGTAGVDIGALAAWDIRREAPDVVVAVVDSGIRYTHEDLVDNLWRNPGETGIDSQGQDRAANGVDDDGNGFIDDIFGINAIDDSSDPMDDLPDPVLGFGGHGTSVAGVIGASGNNGVGISGVAWKVQLMALKWFNNQGAGALSDAIQCIDYAREKGADIVNASWQQSGLMSDTVSQSMVDAIERLRQDGIIFVSSAGNDGANNDLVAHYPSNYPLDNMVAVAATTRNGSLWSKSNYGERMVDLAAPGEGILCPTSKADDDYGILSGTSFAAPHVTGILALLKAQFPDENYLTLINRLMAGAQRNDGLAGRIRSGAMASLFRSISLEAVEDFPEVTGFTVNGTPAASQEEVAIIEGSAVTLSVEVTGSTPMAFEWWRNGMPIRGAATSSFRIAGFSRADIGEYQVAISNNAGTATIGVQLLGVVAKPELAEAVNAADRTFLTTGNTLWDGQNAVSRDGVSAGASGRISANQVTTVSTTVSGPGRAGFTWKVSSERNNDTLDLFVDGMRTDSISGEVEWTRKELILSDGPHEIRWQYIKDGSLSKGEDRGYLDQFDFESTTATAPQILSQFNSQTVVEGSPVFLVVLASGTAPLSYQWLKDGNPVPEATSSRLDIAAATAADAGRYSVVVSNAAGTARSGNLRLTVTPAALPPRIVVHPESRTAVTGSSVSLVVVASGTPPFQYQWRKGETALPGETNQTLTLTSVALSDAGAYSVTISNGAGIDSSRDAILSVVQLQLAPTITKHPTAHSLNEGDSLELVVEATGLGPFSYEWLRDGLPLPGAVGSEYVRDNAVSGDAGVYQARVSNPFGSSVSEAIRVEVRIPSPALGEAVGNPGFILTTEGDSPWFRQEAVSQDGVDALQSGPVENSRMSRLSAQVTGPGQLSFWWKVSSEYGYDFLSFFVDDEFIDGISGDWDWEEIIWNIPEGEHELVWVYSKDEVAEDGLDAGWLDEMSFISFNTESAVVVRHPLHQSRPEGGQATFEIEAAGSPPLTYQWFFDNQPLEGENGSSLSLHDLSLDNEGFYSVSVSNQYGSTTSRLAYLYVLNQAEMVDYSLNLPGLDWADFGTEPWFAQDSVSFDGDSALQSGPIGDGQESWLGTTVVGPGILYFAWKVSSEKDFDFVEFLVNEELYDYQSGEVDWEDLSFLIPPGQHDLDWVYSKDDIFSDGADAAWLDFVQYQALDTFSYWLNLYFLPGELSDPHISGEDADPDRDRRTNFEEFAFGLNPALSGDDMRPVARLVEISQERFLEVTYLRRTDDPDLIYSMAVSTDMMEWTTSPASHWQETTTPYDEGLEQVRARYHQPVSSNTALFARIEAGWPVIPEASTVNLNP